jgi:hypothetical protein
MEIQAGTRLGPYEIVAPVGAGGMGQVWRATDTRLEREVAVKLLPGDYSADAQFLARFEREAKAISAPRWSREGRSLYFLSGDKLFRAAAPFDSEPELLFENRDIVSYEVTPDEKRILAVLTSDFDASPPTRVITNWRAFLARRGE